MTQQPVGWFETRDIGGIADPFTEWVAMAHGDGADARGAGGRQSRGRIFDSHGRLGHEPESLESELVCLGRRFGGGHVLSADDHVERIGEARNAQNGLDVFAPGARDHGQANQTVQFFDQVDDARKEPRRIAEQLHRKHLLAANPVVDLAFLDPARGEKPARNSRSSSSAAWAATSSAICHPITESVRCQAAMWWLPVSAITPSKSKRIAFGGMSCNESADRKDWDDAGCIITNRCASRQIIDNRTRQPYLAIRGIQSAPVRLTRSVPSPSTAKWPRSA